MGKTDSCAEGKGDDMHKKKEKEKGVGPAGPEMGRQTGRDREGTVSGMGKQGALSLSLQPLLVFWPAASSSINSTQRNGEGGTIAGEEKRYSGKRWRGKEVQEEDAALMIRRTGEEGRRWRKNGNRGKEGLDDRYWRQFRQTGAEDRKDKAEEE